MRDTQDVARPSKSPIINAKYPPPNGASFNDALRMVIADLGCITCQKGFNLPRDMASHISAGLRETTGDFLHCLP